MENYRSEPVNIFSTVYSPPEASDSPPIIFLHGWCSTNRTWNHVKYNISDLTKRKIYAIDLRNHGESDWPDEFSMELCADDLENFMVTENIPKAVLVAHSVGGRVAMTLAFRRPEMVEKLVIEDICLVDTERSIQSAMKIMGILISTKKAIKFLPSTMTELEAHKKFEGYLVQLFPEVAKNASSGNISLTLPFCKNKSGNFVWEVDIETCTRLEKDMDIVKVDLSDDPVFHGDMLLLGGDKSEALTKSDVDLFYKHFPKCKTFFFEGGYHNLHMEFQEKYIEMVANFIGE